MKKIFRYLAVAVLGMAFALPAASSVEAAKLAVVPLIMNSHVEDPQGMKPMVFSEAVGKLFKYPEYDMVDRDIVKKTALELQDKVFTEAGMKAICAASGADISVAMSLDNFGWKETAQTSNSPTTVCDFRGQFATYNRLTGKYKHENWSDDASFETGALSPRRDWAHEELARYFRIMLKDALVKK